MKGSVELRKALNLRSENINDLTFSKIATAAHDVENKDIYWKSDNRTIAGVYCGIPQASTKERLWKHLSCDNSSNYNSETVAQLLVRGGLETDKNVQAEVNGKSVDLVAVRPIYASTLIAGNIISNEINISPDENKNIKEKFRTDSINGLKTFPNADDIEKASFEQQDTVTFGIPIVNTAKDANPKCS